MSSDAFMLVLDKRDHDVVRHALARYIESLQAHVDLLGGNGFIISEIARAEAILQDMNNQKGQK